MDYKIKKSSLANFKVFKSLFVLFFTVCNSLDSMIGANNPPDLILDGTRSGEGSDAIKSLARSLGVPTVALSYGTRDDLRCLKILLLLKTLFLPRPQFLFFSGLHTFVAYTSLTVLDCICGVFPSFL